MIDDNFSRIEIQMLIELIECAEKHIEEVKEMIASIGKQYFEAELDLLMTIPGFSFLSALALLADIADINRFSTARKYCSYLRAAPRIRESNKTTHIGNINKESRSLTLTFLTQSVLHFRKSSDYFGDFYDRLKEGKSFGKTRIALIRKILVCTYYMLKRKEKFKWSDDSGFSRKKKELTKMAERFESERIKSAA